MHTYKHTKATHLKQSTADKHYPPLDREYHVLRLDFISPSSICEIISISPDHKHLMRQQGVRVNYIIHLIYKGGKKNNNSCNAPIFACRQKAQTSLSACTHTYTHKHTCASFNNHLWIKQKDNLSLHDLLFVSCHILSKVRKSTASFYEMSCSTGWRWKVGVHHAAATGILSYCVTWIRLACCFILGIINLNSSCDLPQKR